MKLPWKIKNLSTVWEYYGSMEDTFIYFIPFVLVFGAALFLYTFRSAATDILYLAMKNRAHTAFIAVFITAGLFIGSYNSHLNDVLDNYNIHISMKKMSRGNISASTIDQCKQFVEAKLEGKADYNEPSPLLGDVIRIGAKSYWDTCANAFGINSWKHDIFINGETGGAALCKAYRKNSYRSGNVENWCATVLAPGHKI